MAKRSQAKGRREHGSFVALPHAVIRHKNFATLSPRATKLLFDLLASFNGKNNGDFSAAWTLMKKRGWRSRDQLDKARKELLERGFIVKTRQGGRNKCSLFAVTFFAIDECNGKLEVPATSTATGEWKLDSHALDTGHIDTRGGLKRQRMNGNSTQLTRHECQSGPISHLR